MPRQSKAKAQAKTPKPKLNELTLEKGSSGTKLFGGHIYEEYNQRLAGLRAYEIYDEMRKSDAQINATLSAMELPIRATMWYVESGDTDGEVTEQDEEIKAFIHQALFDKMDITFDDFLRQALTMLTFGFSVFEKVYKVEDDKVYIKKLSQRLARTVWQWKKDENGKIGIVQFVPMNDEGKPSQIEIPGDKLLRFTLKQEGDNYEGTSTLRSSYKHWYIKDTLYKLEAVKHERQSIGIPKITLPSTATPEDADEAENIVANLRATEKGYIILPNSDWHFEFANMGAGTTSNVQESIAHHNREIAKNILAQFLELGASGGGSYALSEDQQSLFLLALTSVAKQIAETINRELIPELVSINFDTKANQTLPKLCFNKLGEVDYNKFTSAISTLASAGVLTPDESLEEHARKVLDLPKKIEEENNEEGQGEEIEDEMQEDTDMENMESETEEAEGNPDADAIAKKLGFTDHEEMRIFAEIKDTLDPTLPAKTQIRYVRP